MKVFSIMDLKKHFSYQASGNLVRTLARKMRADVKVEYIPLKTRYGTVTEVRKFIAYYNLEESMKFFEEKILKDKRGFVQKASIKNRGMLMRLLKPKIKIGNRK